MFYSVTFSMHNPRICTFYCLILAIRYAMFASFANITFDNQIVYGISDQMMMIANKK